MRYAKRGAVVRWENGTLVRVVESGVAVERDGEFICHPAAAEALELPDSAVVADVADAIGAMVERPLRIERLIVLEGVAEHTVESRRWKETIRRVHLSLVAGTERALVDLGSFQLTDVAEVAAALARCGPVERPAPPRMRLAPRVAAALLPSLAGIAPPNVVLMQTAGAIDGRGADVLETRLQGEPWPNWYRPSYRTRPVRMPFDLRLECAVRAVDASGPRAVAMLAPPRGLVLRVLVADGESVYPSTVRVNRIDAVASERTWYPFGAGSFGAELML